MQKPQPHIQLSESIHAKYALLPGDPARLDRIIPFLENVQEQTFSPRAVLRANIKACASLPCPQAWAAYPWESLWRSFPASAFLP